MRRTIPAFSILAALVIGAFSIALPPAATAQQSAQASSEEAKRTLDQVILSSGTVIEGEILEETDTTVRIMVIRGSIKAPATYQKSDIFEIKRGAVEVGAAPTPERKPAVVRPQRNASVRETAADENAAQLYVMTLEEIFGVHSSQTPLREAFEEADRFFGDLDSSGQVYPELRDRNIVVIKLDTETDPRRGFDGIWRTEDISPVVEDQLIRKQRRVVFWIEKANGGAAFLPWISPEIYFMSDGEMGGIGSLGDFNMGDEMVNEKQISLRLGHAEGFAIKGGYDEIGAAIIRAMARQQNWLCVKWVGGRPVFLEAEPPEAEKNEWIVLTDDGIGKNKDEFAYKGNDVLRLNADMAFKLGVSRGTADTIDELAFELGVSHNYVEVKDNRASKVLERWKDQIDRAIADINGRDGRLMVEFAEINVAGDYNDRRRLRGRQLRLLEQIRSTYGRFAEVLDPAGTARADIDVQIAQIRQQAEEDARNNRRRG